MESVLEKICVVWRKDARFPIRGDEDGDVIAVMTAVIDILHIPIDDFGNDISGWRVSNDPCGNRSWCGWSRLDSN